VTTLPDSTIDTSEQDEIFPYGRATIKLLLNDPSDTHQESNVVYLYDGRGREICTFYNDLEINIGWARFFLGAISKFLKDTPRSPLR